MCSSGILFYVTLPPLSSESTTVLIRPFCLPTSLPFITQWTCVYLTPAASQGPTTTTMVLLVGRLSALLLFLVNVDVIKTKKATTKEGVERGGAGTEDVMG